MELASTFPEHNSPLDERARGIRRREAGAFQKPLALGPIGAVQISCLAENGGDIKAPVHEAVPDGGPDLQR